MTNESEQWTIYYLVEFSHDNNPIKKSFCGGFCNEMLLNFRLLGDNSKLSQRGQNQTFVYFFIFCFAFDIICIFVLNLYDL